MAFVAHTSETTIVVARANRPAGVRGARAGKRVVEPEENIPRFPALLDTGNNFAFSVQDRHLREWAGLDPGLLVVLGDIEINGQVVTRRRATVWLYPNVPGRQDAADGRPPFRLDLNKGIAVYPPDAVPPGPRLPLLGLPALLENDLDLWLEVNGRRMQTGTTGNLIFDVPHLIHYVSQFMSLQPGDVISTGTPPGVGMGQKPPKYLQPGDKIQLGVQGLGEQNQTVIAAS